MSDNNIVEMLGKIECFRGFQPAQLDRIAKISRIAEFPTHSEIFHENQAPEDVYAIVEGKVSLIISTPSVGRRQLTVVSNGDLIGWSALLKRSRLTDTACTLTRVHALAINGEKLMALCEEDPQFGWQLMRQIARLMADRLSATRLQLLDICGVSLPQFAIESD